MTLSLQTIQTLTWGTDRATIEVTLSSGEHTAIDLKAANGRLDDSWLWLNRSFQTKKPVAFEATTGVILPATVVLSVQVSDPDDGTDIQVFGPPRPGIMVLDRKAPFADDVLAVLKKAEASEASAVLALRGGLQIEDVQILTKAQAKQLLGFREP